MGTEEPEYDIVLVMTTFRRVMVYLPILKELGGSLRIGLYLVETARKDRRKTGRTDRLFVQLCERLGARRLTRFPARARLAIIPQWPYTTGQLAALRERVLSERVYVLIGLTTGNLHMDKLVGLRVDALLIIDMDLYRFRLDHRPEEASVLEGSLAERIEVGLPFARHPVFDDLGIDYLLANPTPLSLPTPRDRIAYLVAVLRLISALPPAERISLKPHNAVETHDYIVSPLLLAAVDNPLMRPAWGFLKRVSERLLRALEPPRGRVARLARRLLENAVVAVNYGRVLRRVTPLRDLTPYHHFSLEVFLPQVRKGLITGRSNSIWHGLYCRLPVYNCVDETAIDPARDKMNVHTMRYLGVPYCGGEPRFDERHFATVRDEVRQRDLIAFLRQEVESLRSAELAAVGS